MKWLCPSSPSDPRLQEVAAALKSDGLAIIPTDTVYGLSANALSPVAVTKVFQAKQRAQGKPLIVIASEIAMARSLAAEWTDEVEQLASQYWPGPLSIIVKAADHIPTLVTADSGKVAIRIPNNPITLRIIELANTPLVSTSANISGNKSPNTAEEAVQDLGLIPEWVIDTGPGSEVESTVVDATGDKLQVLRQGQITI